MQAPPSRWVSDSLSRLRQAIRSGRTSQLSAANATGVDQSQISRILAGQTKRVSPNVLILCKYANTLHIRTRVDPTESDCLMDALRAVWDGSHAHAEALAGVIRSLANLKGPGL